MSSYARFQAGSFIVHLGPTGSSNHSACCCCECLIEYDLDSSRCVSPCSKYTKKLLYCLLQCFCYSCYDFRKTDMKKQNRGKKSLDFWIDSNKTIARETKSTVMFLVLLSDFSFKILCITPIQRIGAIFGIIIYH